MSVVLQSSGGGSVTIAEPTTASNFTATLPAATGQLMVSGNMPAFSANPSVNQVVTSGVNTKILFQTEQFDTNNNFASSRFTPTVAGYYQINLYLSPNTSNTRALVMVYKNGVRTNIFADMAVNMNTNGGSTIIFLNGTTDYVEGWGFMNGTGPEWNSASDSTFFSGCLVRAA